MLQELASRVERAVEAAAAAGLDGLVLTPGADLRHVTGYQPVLVSERLTALVLRAGEEPVLVVPTLERPDAERTAGALGGLVDWGDGSDPYAIAGELLPRGRYGISDVAWALQV